MQDSIFTLNSIEILKKYWKHNSFRPFQEEIIQSVISRRDTLAILPTGSGKSICFQIPGLSWEGITLVVSPLISLMNDQVENLKKRNISAIAFHSGITKREADIEYSNIKNGKYKFVYVSPERISSDRFKEVIAETPINLIAVDEAHCISQWGYDFRPEYLLISELRQILVDIPCVALTASATQKVENDIRENLLFKKPANTFRQSINRPNLNYVVLQDENKNERLIKISRNLKGCGIVYTKNRKSTVALSTLLNKNGIVADFYHAGLELGERNLKQASWQKGFTRVMVCTNAFGMGIDKSNVRFVVHYEMPDSLEAYYQEAGRAGRDGLESWCVVLFSDFDKSAGEKWHESKFLDRKKVQAIFRAICAHYQIAYHSGQDESYEINIMELAKKYKIPINELHNGLDILQKDGLIKLSDAYANPSRLRITASPINLYKFYLVQPLYELFIKTLLRMYGGIYDNYIQISEPEIANNLKIPPNKVKSLLAQIHNLKLADYIPQNSLPTITMLLPRPVEITYDTNRWKQLKQNAYDRLVATHQYILKKQCRELSLSQYFGDSLSTLCGRCDICRDEKSTLKGSMEKVKLILASEFNLEYSSLETINNRIGGLSVNMEALRFFMDNGQLVKNSKGLFKWKS